MMSFKSNPLTVIRFILVSLLAVVSSIYYPLIIVGTIAYDKLYLILMVANLIINGWDLIANYNIYKDKSEHYSSLARDLGIRKKNLWLFIDLLAVFPYELFGLVPVLLLRSLKLLRLSQHQKLWRRRDLKRNDFLYIVFFLFWITLAAHWLACGWIALEPGVQEKDTLSLYIEAMYWTIQTLTTVGFGDIVAETRGQMVYSMVVMMFGVGIYGWLIGNVAGILSKRDSVEQYYYENMERLKTIVGNRGLPPELQHKIGDYYDYIFSRNYSGKDEQIFLNSLPESLRNEVMISLKQRIIRMISAFSESPEDFIREISGELKTEIFIPGDIIFEEGATGDKMYFLLSGELEVVAGQERKHLATLKAGDFFGEIALFENTKRNATIISKSYAEAYSLDKAAFNYVLLRFPNVASVIMAKAAERRSSNGKSEN